VNGQKLQIFEENIDFGPKFQFLRKISLFEIKSN